MNKKGFLNKLFAGAITVSMMLCITQSGFANDLHQYDSMLIPETEARDLISSANERIRPALIANYNTNRKIYLITTAQHLQILIDHAKIEQQYIYIIRGPIDMGFREWAPPYRGLNMFNGILLFERDAVLMNKDVKGDGEGSFLGVMGPNGRIFEESSNTLTQCGRITGFVPLPLIKRLLKKLPCCSGETSVDQPEPLPPLIQNLTVL
ncbi:MAG: hypothetical protein LBJ83_02195 [Oscillospiraceae bacterium]|jgi:hypothetical protein|nr:hypothetical protein [Oscillospiraceae bacterium]